MDQDIQNALIILISFLWGVALAIILAQYYPAKRCKVIEIKNK
jgi:hypothetical protein